MLHQRNCIALFQIARNSPKVSGASPSLHTLSFSILLSTLSHSLGYYLSLSFSMLFSPPSPSHPPSPLSLSGILTQRRIVSVHETCIERRGGGGEAEKSSHVGLSRSDINVSQVAKSSLAVFQLGSQAAWLALVAFVSFHPGTTFNLGAANFRSSKAAFIIGRGHKIL